MASPSYFSFGYGGSALETDFLSSCCWARILTDLLFLFSNSLPLRLTFSSLDWLRLISSCLLLNCGFAFILLVLASYFWFWDGVYFLLYGSLGFARSQPSFGFFLRFPSRLLEGSITIRNPHGAVASPWIFAYLFSTPTERVEGVMKFHSNSSTESMNKEKLLFRSASTEMEYSPSSLFFIFFFLLRTNRKRSEIPRANAFLNPGKLLWSGTLRELTFVPVLLGLAAWLSQPRDVLLWLIRVETAPMEERRWRFS